MTTVTLPGGYKTDPYGMPSLFVFVPWRKTGSAKEGTIDRAPTTQSQTSPVSTIDLTDVQERARSIAPLQTREQMAQAMPATEAREDLADDQLIVAICDGAEWAMELLYERHARSAFALAFRMLRDVPAAEDVVQEAFLSVWRKAGSYQRQHGSVHSWIQAIVHHRAIDVLRTAGYRESHWTREACGAEYEQDPVSEEPEVWEQAWQGERQRVIRAVLAQLPAEQRFVIEQAYFGGYTHAEIAERWHIPLGTVKGRMRLGLQKMKYLLEERGIDAL